MHASMVGRGHGEAGFAKLGIAILGFAALVVMLSGVDGVPGSVATPNPSDQLAQVFNIQPPAVPTAETASQSAAEPAAEQAVSTTNVSCQAALPDNVSADHYLRRQLIQNVGGAESACGVNSDGSVVIAGSASGTCPAYPGPSGEGATPQCPTAVVYRDTGRDDYVICWNTDPNSNCPAQTSQTNEGTGDTASDETAGDRLDAVTDSLADSTPTDTSTELGLSSDGLSIYDPVSDQYIDLADYGFTESWSDQGFEGWIAPDGTFYSESQLRDMFPGPSGPEGAASFQNEAFQGTEGRYIETGRTGGTPVFQESVDYSASPVTENQTVAPSPAIQPTQTTPNSAAAPPTTSQTPANPATQTAGTPNPVTATQSTSGNGRFPGTRLDNPGSYETQRFTDNFNGGAPYSQPRYRSLETPQERALRERMRSHFGGSREPSIVERFAQLIGADSRPVMRTSPQSIQGGTTPRQIDVVTRTAPPLIIRSTDAHYRSIEQIARDVTRDDIPGDSRVDHFARAVRAVGSPDTQTRATTNEALASLQDLIVEDEAIRAMFVAEQTAEREKNRVFCVDGEESANCQARRTAVAERIERETFVAELEKRELPDNAVQHFLAVYDGWVRPDVPVPASNPLLLADAPASASLTPDAGARATATTTNEGFVSWAWGGVRNGAERMFEALRQWLTP